MTPQEALDIHMRRVFDAHQAAVQRNRDQWNELNEAEAKRPWWVSSTLTPHVFARGGAGEAMELRGKMER